MASQLALATSAPHTCAEGAGMLFENRRHAGQALAEALAEHRGADGVVVGLPRGGVLVAAWVARGLGLPLDVFVVRKVGAPDQPELAVGAVAETGALDMNQELCRAIGLGEAQLAALIARERREIERRVARYRPGGGLPAVGGKLTIVVDDGVATGYTVKVALRALRSLGARPLVLAVPLGPAEVVHELASEAERVICLQQPQPFVAVGAWYRRFDQVSDTEVEAALRDGRSALGVRQPQASP